MVTVGDDTKRICKHIHVGLLDELAVVACIFHCHSLGIVSEDDVVRHFHPTGVYLFSKYLGGLGDVAEYTLCRTVCECIVIHIFGILVSSHHIDDGIAAVRILLDTAEPEVCNRLKHRPRCLLQPLLVLSHTVVLPHCDTHIRCDVMLVCTGKSPHRSALFTRSVGLPRVLGSSVTMILGVLYSLRQATCTIIHKRTSRCRIHHQNRRIHPKLCVPEVVAVVTLA